MVRKVKQLIQNKLNSICYEKYVQETERQKDSYRQWYLQNEGWKTRRFPAADPDIIIFADRDGIVEERAAEVVTAFFHEHPYVQIAYADEDCLDEAGRRYSPWFKPQWSPDTLDDFQYFGHFFAVQRKLLDDIPEREWQECLTDCGSLACYRLLLTLTKKVTGSFGGSEWIYANDSEKAIMPIGRVLIHMKREKADAERGALSAEASTQSDPPALPEAKGAPKRIQEMLSQPAAASKATDREEALISIIIPSKDNPSVLRTCIVSILDHAVPAFEGNGNGLCGRRIPFEIIVVDNGSGAENRTRIEEMARQYDFRYLYEPMPFNFSRMCNLGAEAALGDYLLLLNDDMEILQPDWLAKLYEKASLPHAGAVGAKLLYPDSDLIQHIGITNIKVGPVHKLLKQHDEVSHYHGQNRHIYDMIGVTAACLLVSRTKFEEAGRFYEGMAVAYNDVDFCFALYELGYYNILRNDVVLYHHESLSRGDDNLSDEKWVRLLKEKDILYARHPSLKAFDPFYSRNLAVHSNLYLPAYMYAFEKRDYYTALRLRRGGVPIQWENGCLILNVEHAREEKKLEFTERDDVYWIEGWSYVLGMDNDRYKRKLLLQGTKGRVYEAEVLDRYRPDVEAILPQQRNVALAGFVCRIPKDALPPDTYMIAMLAKDRCSNQRLYQKSDRTLDADRGVGNQ